MDATIQSLLEMFLKTMLRPLIPILIGLATLSFFWGLYKYLKAGMGDSEIKGAKSLMLWGIVTLFVMFSVWGLVAILQNTFFGDEGVPTALPNVPTFGVGEEETPSTYNQANDPIYNSLHPTDPFNINSNPLNPSEPDWLGN